ncbi:DNA-binding NarL/FixJ family response regulator [Streptomyces demainii]|uniref:DNA-binding NarL/FixJ family response regulator n=2 Tax=Streptomyces TaxID=1883 RepID=A0ABT9KLK7_9ACTN|nr:DNA-binding NarL/FixJ family response regulator [Streptomyces demainii]
MDATDAMGAMGAMGSLGSADAMGGMGSMGGADAMGGMGGMGGTGGMGAMDTAGGTGATGATGAMGTAGGTGATGATGTAGGTGAVDAAGVPGPAGGVPAPAAAGAGGAGPDDTGVPRRVRVVLVDDHRMFRTGVQAEIGDTARTGVEVVGEAADVDQAVTVITATRPEVVLLDVHLPGGGGVEVLRRSASMMADQNRPVRFLALSVSDAAEDVIGVIRGGARGYVTKTITGTDLVDAIFRVAEGDAVFSPRLAGFVLDAFASTDAPPVDEDLDRLTQREREVLRLIARGYAYKEIAKQLFISVKTVESHVSAVLRKLQLSNRHELTRWATARRLV